MIYKRWDIDVNKLIRTGDLIDCYRMLIELKGISRMYDYNVSDINSEIIKLINHIKKGEENDKKCGAI